MGYVRGQSKGTLLFADEGGQEAGRARAVQVGTPLCRRQPRGGKDLGRASASHHAVADSVAAAQEPSRRRSRRGTSSPHRAADGAVDRPGRRSEGGAATVAATLRERRVAQGGEP